MKFGPLAPKDAQGAILAHSVAVNDGRLRKGVVLTAAHVAQLLDANITEIMAAVLEPTDVHEDTAAERLARAVIGRDHKGLRLGKAATGRVNIYADTAGLAHLDAARIHALNRVHPMITVATVPECHRLEPGGMVATIKIISFAVPQAALDEAVQAGQGAIGFHLPVLKNAALIETDVGTQLSDKGARALAMRLERLGGALTSKVSVAHDIGALAAALKTTKAEVIFVLSGSATSDMYDTAPEALRRAGGHVYHYGMPVDPGNLLFIGELDGTPVIGLPGCARSPALNGADWVMERVICGVAVGPEDIMAMGVGGLLKEIPSRPRPREA